MTTKVEDFIYEYEGTQRNILEYLHHLLVHDFDLTAKIRYGIPFYYGKSWICYLNPKKKESIELAFTRGIELSNAQGLLHAKDRKQVLSVEFKSVREIPKESIMEIISEALLLDETIRYASKNKKK